MREKIIRWLIFSVLLALMPVGLNCLFTFTVGKVPTLASLFSRGELLLISASIVARAMGELMTAQSNRRISKLIAGGSGVIMHMTASAWFGLISAGIAMNADFVSWVSIVFFVIAMLVSGCILLITER